MSYLHEFFQIVLKRNQPRKSHKVMISMKFDNFVLLKTQL